MTTKQTLDGLKRALAVVQEDNRRRSQCAVERTQTLAALTNTIQKLEREYEKEENLELGL